MQKYGDETYWSEKYTHSNRSSFEWYATLDDMREILQEGIASLTKSGVGKASILLPGCGDSNFAEEMIEKGQL